jgi:hypothetical protein
LLQQAIDQALTSQGVAPAPEIIEGKPAGNVSVFLGRVNGHLIRLRAAFGYIGRWLDAGAGFPQGRSTMMIFV